MDFRELNADEAGYRDRGIALACKMLNVETAPDSAALQAIYDWCLAQGWDEDRLDQRPQVVALGMAFGDLLVREQGFSWAWCDDGENAHLALRVPGQSIAIWPLWMICRRLAAADATTIDGMIAGVLNTLNDQTQGKAR